MPLPTISIRVAPEHQRLIRYIAGALRTRPELADVLHEVLQSQHEPATDRVTDVLQDLIARLDEHERRLAALENASTQVTDGATGQPRPTPSAKGRPALRVPEDVQRQIRRMKEAGMTRDDIARELGISTGAVSKYWKPKPE
jgi:DNA-binding NarL/FixJ family response regulator